MLESKLSSDEMLNTNDLQAELANVKAELETLRKEYIELAEELEGTEQYNDMVNGQHVYNTQTLRDSIRSMYIDMLYMATKPKKSLQQKVEGMLAGMAVLDGLATEASAGINKLHPESNAAWQEWRQNMDRRKK